MKMANLESMDWSDVICTVEKMRRAVAEIDRLEALGLSDTTEHHWELATAQDKLSKLLEPIQNRPIQGPEKYHLVLSLLRHVKADPDH